VTKAIGQIRKAACLLLPVTGLIGLGEKPPLEEVDFYLEKN